MNDQVGHILWRLASFLTLMALIILMALGGNRFLLWWNSSSVVTDLIAMSTRKETFFAYNKTPGTLRRGDLSQAEAFINGHKDYRSYHLLLALRRDHAQIYARISNATRASILSSMLATTHACNDWSYLEPSETLDTEPARALLECGPVILRFLEPMLDDTRPARFEGSKEATLSFAYNFRRADFAYRYISLVLGYPAPFDSDPRERDKRIQALKAKL